MSITNVKIVKRIRRHTRVRSVVKGSAIRPRLAVFRSNQHIHAQLIDDNSGKTLAATSSVTIKTKGTKSEIASAVGSAIAQIAKDKKINEVVFDRGGFKYHGRVKALADAARESGLKF